MNIICDTNIWYYIGDKSVSPDLKDGDKLVAVNPSIEELFRTHNIFQNVDIVANAIRAIMTNSRDSLRELPPAAYLKTLDDPDFKFQDIDGNLYCILRLTEMIANDNPINGELRDTMIELIADRKKSLKVGADTLNNEMLKIKNRHHKSDSKAIDKAINHKEFLFSLINVRPLYQTLSSDFDWSKIELLEKTIKVFFHKTAISSMKMTPNDWYDIVHLLYVRPGELYWTSERRWINLIKEAKMDKYLYKFKN